MGRNESMCKGKKEREKVNRAAFLIGLFHSGWSVYPFMTLLPLFSILYVFEYVI